MRVVRFEADQPNECWQSDFTHYRLADGLAAAGHTAGHAVSDGSDAALEVEIISWLDDHARYALHVSAHLRITGPIVLQTFRAAFAAHGIPHPTLTDNGMVYTVRLATRKARGGRNAFENELAAVGVVQKKLPTQPPHHLRQGRAVPADDEELARPATRPARHHRPAAGLLDQFVTEYNTQRPHRSLKRRTPATAYTARPKATLGSEPTVRTHARTHDRVREDRVSKTGNVTLRHHGRLHHIGLGRAHAGTNIYLLVEDLNIRVIDAVTGELLRELTLDPTRDYQPQNPK